MDVLISAQLNEWTWLNLILFYQGYDAQDKDAKFPEACLDLSVNHLTCLMSKREVAMKSVELLAGKDAVEKNFPYYEENKQKTLEMIELYKSKRATPDGAFWQPAV